MPGKERIRHTVIILPHTLAKFLSKNTEQFHGQRISFFKQSLENPLFDNKGLTGA